MTQAAPLPTPGRRRRTVLTPVLLLLGLAVCGLVVLGLVVSSVGPTGVVVGVLCALLPVGPVVATFLWVDRWEPEPPVRLLMAFGWGACFAALSALLINSGAALIADEVLGRGSGDVIGAVAVAPFVEEAVKGAFVVGLLIFRRREFDGIVDGIVYAGLVAAGFAFTENVLYIGRAFTEDSVIGQSGGVLAVLLLRGVLSPFAHPLFTSMIGIGAGIAANSRSVPVRIIAVTVGYLVAVALHALWNGSATLFGGAVFFGVYAFVMVPLFVALIAVVVWQRRREQRTVTDQLPGFAQAGWIAPSEIPLLSSLAGRRGWRAAVRRRSGRKAAKAVSDYQAAVTELAFLQARLARGSVGPSGVFWRGEALEELQRARAQAVGHPEALTVAIAHHGPPGWAPPPAGPPGQGHPSPGRPSQGSPSQGARSEGHRRDRRGRGRAGRARRGPGTPQALLTRPSPTRRHPLPVLRVRGGRARPTGPSRVSGSAGAIVRFRRTAVGRMDRPPPLGRPECHAAGPVAELGGRVAGRVAGRGVPAWVFDVRGPAAAPRAVGGPEPVIMAGLPAAGLHRTGRYHPGAPHHPGRAATSGPVPPVLARV